MGLIALQALAMRFRLRANIASFMLPAYQYETFLSSPWEPAHYHPVQVKLRTSHSEFELIES